jgi:murein DD-endopeptidase MepM/ murein hydrolase activator NlpD
VVEIDHGNGYMTRYAHNSKLLVRPGQRVHVGEVISQAGSTGRSTGPHVHFEVWYKGRVVNPLAYVKSHR